jgi:DNA ligase-1
VRLADLVATSAAVAATSSRLGKIERLADLLSRAGPEDIEIAVSFLSGATRQGRIGVGAAAIMAASDAPAAESPQLELRDVDASFAALARISGSGAARDRAQALRELFARATRDEHDFLRRLLFGELRQGALAGVLVDAIARATGVGADRVRRAAMMAGDLGVVARAAITGGEAALEPFSVQLMRPVEPMLADTAESASAAVAEMGDTLVDYKLDGARIQAHKSGDEVRLFSRSLRDVTFAAPEVTAIVRAFPPRELILDGEAIALRPDGAPHPFQITMRRFGRKPAAGRGAPDAADRTSNAEAAATADEAGGLRLTPFFFDCLYVDGAPLIDEPLERRATVLAEAAGAAATPRIVRPTPEQADAFAREALARGHEGVMAKALASPYAAGRRGAAWRKIKQARTLDLVVLAAEWGHGRRRGWLSNLHLGARDPERGSFVMLGKTFKGMTDEMLAWQTEKLLSLEIARDAYTVHVRPELVVEIAFNEIQTSSTYAGGLALRFARVKRHRTDKGASDADTIATVRSLAAAV